MNRIRRFLARLVCRFDGHDLDLVRSKVVGATLSWGLTPTREYRFDYVCKRCGHEIFRDGYYLPGDRQRHPDRYNDRGWPIDENGNELKVNE